jgi:hypothetical protein
MGLMLTSATTQSLATRLVAGFLALPLLIGFGTCLAGTLRWYTLAYALAPTALQIHYGTRRLRVRYEDVTRIALSEPAASGTARYLWPGAPAGDELMDAGYVARWWGTSLHSDRRVLVETTGGALLLTPTNPLAFCEALQRSVWETGTPTPGQPDAGGWLERVAGIDPGFRVLAALALLVAASGVTAQGLAFGAATWHATIAALGFLLNTALAAVVVRHAPYAARAAMGATLTLVCLGVTL